MSLRVLHVTKRFGFRVVVQDVSLQVADGELVALLGPSGSGKSTLLRIIAGLATCDSGRVEVDGQDVTDLSPQSRDLGFVFQNYALFEHLSVSENVEFALRVRGIPRRVRAQRRDQLLEQVGLAGSGRKYPAQLSGGQRQRTALARALAHQPRLLLLDEPFGALDAQIRQELRQGLRSLLKEINTTAVFVTHDQEEAFSVADRIMILHRGRLLEHGPPADLYHRPRSEFVARFVGRANILPGEMTADGVRVKLGTAAHPKALPRRVKVLFRPEQLYLAAPRAAPSHEDHVLLSRDAVVSHVEYLGASERIELNVSTEAGEASVADVRLNVIRATEDRAQPQLVSGDRVAVFGRQPHAITRPSLRLLALADDVEVDRQMLVQILDHAEREHGVLTVLGAAVSSTHLAARLDQCRQAFAGDLRLIDPQEHRTSLLEAARTWLDAERFDLVFLPPSLFADPNWFDLLRQSGVRHVLLPGRAPLPLSSRQDTRWALLVRRFSMITPDLGLFGELLQTADARVELHDLGGPMRHGELVERSLAALLLRTAKISIAGLRSQPAEASDLDDLDSFSSDLFAVDLGPRSLLGPLHRAWLKKFSARWTLLFVQPDEVDIELGRGPFQPSAGAHENLLRFTG